MSKSESEVLLLQAAIQQLLKCEAVHEKTVFVDEKFEGKTIWQGEVKVFELFGHPKAEKCYAWFRHETGADAGPPDLFAVILNRWPVDSPQAAIRFAIAFDVPVHHLSEVMPAGIRLS